MKAPMIAIQSSAASHPITPFTPVASMSLVPDGPGSALDVTDGLVSIGQQAWMNGVATSILH